MTNTIDGNGPQGLNIVFEDVGEPMKMLFVEVETMDGKSVNAGEWHKRADGLWELRIRNRPQPGQQYPAELVERMIKLVRFVERSITHPSNRDEARAILAELESVDPDLELAREMEAEACEANGFPERAAKARAGDIDNDGPIRCRYEAIKRVRAEKG